MFYREIVKYRIDIRFVSTVIFPNISFLFICTNMEIWILELSDWTNTETIQL